eukprot:m.312484 g.312484  ORF g.312484 m.312484 type:complete len:189 (+) comp20240_c0_seq1:1488-2054(+)
MAVLDIGSGNLIHLRLFRGKYYATNIHNLIMWNPSMIPGALRGGSNSFVQGGKMCGFGHATHWKTLEQLNEENVTAPMLLKEKRPGDSASAEDMAEDERVEEFVFHAPFKWCFDAEHFVVSISRVVGDFQQNIVDPCSVWMYGGKTYVSTAASDVMWMGPGSEEQHYNTSIWTVSPGADSVDVHTRDV